MYLPTLLLFCSLWIISIGASTVPTHGRTKFNFNSDWKVSVGDEADAQNIDFNDSDWKGVTLPYAWNEDDAFRVDIANLSTGIAWYRKHFKVPESTADQKLFLEFEGIRFAGEFYLNGKWIGGSENGVMAFGFDVTDAVLRNQTNVVAARIDNSWDYQEKATGTPFQWNDINFYANYGGINKNVYLHATNKIYQTLPLFSNLHTTGVYIFATDIDIDAGSAKITAEAQIRNEYDTTQTFQYQAVIEDPNGQVQKTLNGGEYTLHPNQTMTIRASETVSNLQFWSWGYGYLYDVHTTLNVKDQEIDRVTTRTGFRKTEFTNGMFKLNDRTMQVKGYAQRTTNEWPALGCAVPPVLSDMSNQLVLESHGSLIRWMHVTPWKQDIESLDRLGIMQAMPAGDSEGDSDGRQWEQRVELMRDAMIYNKNNPSIIFYESGNEVISEEHMERIIQLRNTYDPHGGRAAGSREMLNSTVAEYGGEMLYIDKSSDIPFWAMEYERDEGLRKYWDNWSPPYHVDGEGPLYEGEEAPEYNHNQDSNAVENVHRWFDYYEMRPGTGERVSSGGVNIIFSDSNTHHRGEENYRTSGEVDAVRLPKDGCCSFGWTLNYNQSTTKDVYVVSTADDVELRLNGKSLGWGVQSKKFLFNFTNVAWEAGELEAIGSTNNRAVASDSRKTIGEPAAIRLTPYISSTGFSADGNDIAVVEVEVVDADGKRNPIALNTINFNMSGEASWRGGIAQGPGNYILSQTIPVENGVNRVLLRSTTKSGQVVLHATSEGLQSASITLNTEPFESQDGLSTTLPSTGFQSNLSRGPTPQGESYTMKRQALTIASVNAGSNSNQAVNTYDDDELSEWRSDDSDGGAWIEYTLEEEATVDQVVMKMHGFSDDTYPVKVTVDEVDVWNGTTPTSLGYVTLTFKPTEGSKVRIALNDETGSLGIVEAEIYSPVGL